LKFKAIILGLLTGVAGLLISPFNFALNLEEDRGLGLLFKLRGARQPSSDVVVISIDKASSENLDVPDNPDKWPRSLHARLTESLTRAGAKVIVFDVHFIEPRSTADDNLFAEAIEKSGIVVLAEPLKAKEVTTSDGSNTYGGVHNIVKIVKPLPLFTHSALATAPFLLPRIPFKVNQYWTFQTGAGDSPTFPVVAFQFFTFQAYDIFLQLLKKVSPDHARLLPENSATAIETSGIKQVIKDIRGIFEREPLIAQDMLAELEQLSVAPKTYHFLRVLIEMYRGVNTRYINFYGPPRTITTIPYHKALKLPEEAVEGGVDVKDKAVFVGLSEKVLADRKDSFYTVFSQANGIFISGVEIAATVFSNLLEDKPVKAISVAYFITLVLLWGIVIGIICRMLTITLSVASVAGLSVLYLLGALYQFSTTATWFPIIIPLFIQVPFAFFGGVIWNYIDTNKERQKIRKALQYHLPEHVVDQLAKNISHVETGSEVVYGICLTTDAEHYTTLSETMDPQELARFMNKYYETLFKPTKKHGGTVTDIIGDAMMSLWVSSRPDNTLKEKACAAALDIQRAMEGFNRSSDITLNTRVGLNSGQIWLGHIGADDRYEYTIVGDIVNTAARIEGLNKYLGTQVLASEEVVQQLNGFLTRDVGSFRLKGKVKTIVIHEVLCQTEEADEKLKKTCSVFAEGMTAFKTRLWGEAIEKFEQCLESRAHDGPSLYYRELSMQYREQPPGEPWDGVIHMEKK
jgi:adenylate cyclase